MKRLTEKELLEGLDAHGAHADELESLAAEEWMPRERLKGTVKRYEGPFEPLEDWSHADALASHHTTLLRDHSSQILALAAEHGCSNVRVFGSVVG